MDIQTELTEFNRQLRLINRADLTINGYEPQIYNFLKHFNRKPKDIAVHETESYLLTLDVYTRKTAIAALKFFYQSCYNSHKLDHLKYPKLPEYLPDVYSEEEMARLIKVAEVNIKHQTWIMLAYSTGMRIGETLNLKWNHIDRSEKCIHVKMGKGKKDNKCVLTDGMIRQFEKYCKAYKLNCRNSNDRVFQGQIIKGVPKPKYSKKSVAEFLYRYQRIAGIKKRITPHLVRHACFTHLRGKGVDLAAIQQLANHNSIKTTSIYSKLTTFKNIPALV